MPDALDATAEALSRRALATVPADRPRTALDVDTLPAPVARLLHAHLARAVADAAPQPSDWIGGDDVEAAAAAWREAADRSVRFPASAWADAVRQSVRLALAHLVRPAETLADAAFEGADGPLPADAVLDRVREFGPYPYLPQIAARYVERKEVDTLDRDTLAGLLDRIDRRMVSTFGPDDWVTLLGPLLALAGPTGSPPGSVPAGLLRTLFEAKGADALAGTLDGIDAVTPGDLRALLYRALAPADAEAAAALPPDAPADAPAPPTSSPPPPPDAPGPEESDAPATEEPEIEGFGHRPVATEPPALSPPPMPSIVEGVRPPTIGSKYLTPEYDGEEASEVLGPPRPAGTTDPPPQAPTETGPEPSDTPMEEVRDAVATPAPEPHKAPDVPVLDLPPIGPSVPETPPVMTPSPEAPSPPDKPTPADVGAEPNLGASLAPDAEEEPLWKRLAREQGRLSEQNPPPNAVQDDPEEEPIWKRFAEPETPAAPPAPTPSAVPDVSPDAPLSPELDTVEARVLGPYARDRRAWFITELFEGSPSAYHRTLDRIDQSASYTDATRVVSTDVFRAHRVDPYTDSAVAFIDAMQVQFDARR